MTESEARIIPLSAIPAMLRRGKKAGDSQAIASLERRKKYLIDRNDAMLFAMKIPAVRADVFAMTVEEREAYWARHGLPFAGLD